jgi:hypothetical protein
MIRFVAFPSLIHFAVLVVKVEFACPVIVDPADISFVLSICSVDIDAVRDHNGNQLAANNIIGLLPAKWVGAFQGYGGGDFRRNYFFYDFRAPHLEKPLKIGVFQGDDKAVFRSPDYTKMTHRDVGSYQPIIASDFLERSYRLAIVQALNANFKRLAKNWRINRCPCNPHPRALLSQCDVILRLHDVVLNPHNPKLKAGNNQPNYGNGGQKPLNKYVLFLKSRGFGYFGWIVALLSGLFLAGYSGNWFLRARCAPERDRRRLRLSGAFVFGLGCAIPIGFLFLSAHLLNNP